LLDRWHRQAPAMERQALVQKALDGVYGVDLNPFAVAIARFRLTVAALKAAGLTSLEAAPAWEFHLAAGDSLIHGAEDDALPGLEDRTAFMAYTYATEDAAELARILRPGTYDCVVGNPPYITVKDKTLNQVYRAKYSKVCKGKYALAVPFMVRFFELAKTGAAAGWIGQITSNSFMKREFGAPLIEDFLAKKDLRLVVDTSGAYIPGHGTPTVILVGRPQPPVGETVRAILGVRGEPGKPDDPAKGLVWTSIVEHVDDPGWDDAWITVADLGRSMLAAHPWSLSGGGAVDLLTAIASQGSRLALRGVDIGMTVLTGEDDAFVFPMACKPSGWDPWLITLVEGDEVRDYEFATKSAVLLPNDLRGVLREPTDELLRHFWSLRAVLSRRLYFGQTPEQRGKRWLDHAMFFARRHATRMSIALAEVATHNHFVLDRGGKVFKQTAPVIKLSGSASEDDYLSLLGVLNSSTACFWLKQVCHDKGIRGEGGGFTSSDWERFYQYNGSNIQDFPLPVSLPLERGRMLDGLAQRLAGVSPSAMCVARAPSAAPLATAREQAEVVRAEMVAVQEELDWETYRLYGLVEENLTYAGDDLPGLALGERAFEIVLARAVRDGSETTAWFARHGSTPITELPAHWPDGYRRLVQRRLDLIASDPNLRLLEKPEYKRRWAQEPWEKRAERAVRGWLLDRLEDKRFWFDSHGRPQPRSVAQLADEVARDPDLVSVLALWEGRPDVPVGASLTRLLADEAVPYLAALRYKDSGSATPARAARPTRPQCSAGPAGTTPSRPSRSA
jgi:hypothetical protein